MQSTSGGITALPFFEELVYPYFGDRKDAISPNGPDGAYIRALDTHLRTVLST